MRRLIALAVPSLAALALAAPAAAEIAPEHYERERREAPEVVVIEVRSVSGLRFGQRQGRCDVRGVITAVERGPRAVGDEIVIPVPCIRPSFYRSGWVGPHPGYEVGSLRRTGNARVWLNEAGGAIRRGFDALP